jgi:hypothetical protein
MPREALALRIQPRLDTIIGGAALKPLFTLTEVVWGTVPASRRTLDVRPLEIET